MTSGKIEELEKEAESRTKDWKEQKNCIQAYLAGAKPREKRIAELTEQNTSLLTSVENLNKSVQELEAQIEKMRCCGNCDGILDGGRRAEKCHHCMNGKKLSEWRLAND